MRRSTQQLYLLSTPVEDTVNKRSEVSCWILWRITFQFS